MKHPIQPVGKDNKGTLRFKENKLVKFIFDKSNTNLYEIANLDFSDEDRRQFAQLIGYSLSGYSELRYVDHLAYLTAKKMYKQQISEEQAKIIILEELISSLKEQLREPISELYEIHPDDLI